MNCVCFAQNAASPLESANRADKQCVLYWWRDHSTGDDTWRVTVESLAALDSPKDETTPDTFTLQLAELDSKVTRLKEDVEP